MSATGDEPCCAQSGATLLEMLVVVGVLALVAGLVFPNLRRPYETLSVEAVGGRIAADLRSARSQAVRTGAPSQLQVSADGREYSVGQNLVHLPQMVRLIAAPRSIAFGPDGQSAGGSLIVIGRSGARYKLDVEAPLGIVRLERGS
jgi:general secretion pathway protein H